MFTQTIIPQQTSQMSQEPIPSSDVKKMVGEILKRVDQMISKGDLVYAQMEITKAKALDPCNPYIFALEKHISSLKTEFVQREETLHNDKSMLSSVIGDISKTETEIPQMPASPKPKLSTPAHVPVPAVTAPSIAHSPLSTVPAFKSQEKREDRFFDRPAVLASYQQALNHAWCDGPLTGDEERKLHALRAIYGITKAEHEQIEKKVKHDCYRKALLLRQQSDNSITRLNSKSISDLQCTYQISDAEHLYIQTLLKNTMQHKQRDKLLIIDDDARILESLAASLEDNGFDVTTFLTADEAFVHLRKFTPDLILCDIDLETSTIVGFTFYEKIQKLENIKGIPFIFITGLTDEALVRKSKEIGVEDYMMKPLSEQMLVSTIRRKLKQGKQLNNIIATPLSSMAAA
jgi:CheY-like chemotaxis protein